MSSLGSEPRQTPLFNLSDVVREGISASPPRRPSSERSSRASSLDDTPVGYSASLIEPVMDDGEVLSTSLRSDRSSVIMRHKEAAKIGQQRSRSYGTLPTVQYRGDEGRRNFVKKPTSLEDEFEKIQMRNEAKRNEHSTTYALLTSYFTSLLVFGSV